MVDQMVPYEPNARLNVTFGGQNGDYPDPVSYDATDADVKQIATEAIRTGYIPGIPADANVDIQDFVVDRFPATDELPPRLMLRPKTPFGGANPITMEQEVYELVWGLPDDKFFALADRLEVTTEEAHKEIAGWSESGKDSVTDERIAKTNIMVDRLRS